MNKLKNNKTAYALVVQTIFIVVVYGILSFLIGTGIFDKYTSSILTTSSIYAIVALGLNLMTGMTGQLVLGHAGFMSIGAYGSAILLKAGLPLLPSMLISAAIAGAVGLIIGIPTLRLRGDYLAIVTLGFGEIIRVVIMNLEKLTGGAAGLMNIPGLSIKAASAELNTLITFLWVSICLILSILAVVHLLISSHGRAILSVRDDEIASEAMGVNIFYTKLYVFVFSTFLAGVAGSLFASHYRYLNPDMFNYLKSVDFLIIVVFGGMGSITGTVVASFALTMLQEQLRFMKDYRLVIYPALLIAMMIFRPQGLLGTKELRLTRLFSRKWWKKNLAKLKKGGRGNVSA